jgi:hypothetical protein
MSLLVIDDKDPQVYLELRGELVDVIDDPTGDFYAAPFASKAAVASRHEDGRDYAASSRLVRA